MKYFFFQFVFLITHRKIAKVTHSPMDPPFIFPGSKSRKSASAIANISLETFAAILLYESVKNPMTIPCGRNWANFRLFS